MRESRRKPGFLRRPTETAARCGAGRRCALAFAAQDTLRPSARPRRRSCRPRPGRHGDGRTRGGRVDGQAGASGSRIALGAYAPGIESRWPGSPTNGVVCRLAGNSAMAAIGHRQSAVVSPKARQTRRRSRPQRSRGRAIARPGVPARSARIAGRLAPARSAPAAAERRRGRSPALRASAPARPHAAAQSRRQSSPNAARRPS